MWNFCFIIPSPNSICCDFKLLQTLFVINLKLLRLILGNIHSLSEFNSSDCEDQLIFSQSKRKSTGGDSKFETSSQIVHRLQHVSRFKRRFCWLRKHISIPCEPINESTSQPSYWDWLCSLLATLEKLVCDESLSTGHRSTRILES